MVNGSIFGRMPFLSPPAGVEPRFIGRKSVALTTEPRLLLKHSLLMFYRNSSAVTLNFDYCDLRFLYSKAYQSASKSNFPVWHIFCSKTLFYHHYLPESSTIKNHA